MSDQRDGPRPLDGSLARIARSVRRVDLSGLAAVEEAWPGITAAAPSGARPLRLAAGELVVAVDTGTHAARARRDGTAMLQQLAAVLATAPTSIRVVVRRD